MIYLYTMNILNKIKIGVVIPWREQPSRVEPFKKVVSWYQNNLPEAQIYFPNHPGEVYMPSHTRNDGVRQAQADGVDVIVMNDADTIPQIGPLIEAIGAAYLDGLIHNPYTRYKMLKTEGTKQHLEIGIPLVSCSSTTFRDACSGTNVFTPDAWWKLGGMDEKFLQWGYEDTAMYIAHKVINGVPFVKHKGTVFALGHDAQEKTGTHYANNELVFNNYRKISDPQEMLAFVKSS
jgi:hypothetical protein